jgi:LmbE family N-acetylglucosaminyl deacetylase
VATLVTFHAHPDDESIATGGLMMKAKDAGHRVVLVVATRGEHGEIVPGVLASGEQLGVRRVAETFAVAETLGVDRVEFLGYLDSGMMGEPTNDAPGSFWSTDREHAANRLATILREEGPDQVVLTVYDANGGYGHPDHIQVHRVGVRAAELAGVDRVFEATINRDHIKRGFEEAQALGIDLPGGDDIDTDPDLGLAEADITHSVDVMAYVGRKRDALRVHASQIADDSFFLALPEPLFEVAFGTEWFVQRGQPRDGGEGLRTALIDDQV